MTFLSKNAAKEMTISNATQTVGGNALGAIESQEIDFPVFSIEKAGKSVLSLSMLSKEGNEKKEVVLPNKAVVNATCTKSGNVNIPTVKTREGSRWVNPTDYMSTLTAEELRPHLSKRSEEVPNEALPEGASLGWLRLTVSRNEDGSSLSISLPSKTKTNQVPA